MRLFDMLTVSDIIGVITLLLSCIAIYVALYIGRKSSDDCKRMITSHKDNTDAQIKEIREASRNEINQFRTLIHTILVSMIHYLDNEQRILVVSAKEDNHKYLEVLRRYKDIRAWKLKESDIINASEINNHLLDMNLLEEAILELKTNYECNKRSADNINILLNHFISLDKQLSLDKQHE